MGGSTSYGCAYSWFDLCSFTSHYVRSISANDDHGSTSDGSSFGWLNVNGRASYHRYTNSGTNSIRCRRILHGSMLSGIDSVSILLLTACCRRMYSFTQQVVACLCQEK